MRYNAMFLVYRWDFGPTNKKKCSSDFELTACKRNQTCASNDAKLAKLFQYIIDGDGNTFSPLIFSRLVVPGATKTFSFFPNNFQPRNTFHTDYFPMSVQSLSKNVAAVGKIRAMFMHSHKNKLIYKTERNAMFFVYFSLNGEESGLKSTIFSVQST